MSPTLVAFLRSWPWDPWLVAALLLTATIYARGWRLLRRRDPARWPFSRLLAFAAGLAALFLALASPIEPFASLLLQVHMLQHLLLMMVVAPLVWLGAPLAPLLRGLPRFVRTEWLAPFLRARGLRQIFTRLTHPLVALPLFTTATWLWHAPALYDAALRWPALHVLQHASFLLAALAFWYPVVRPWPARPSWSAWILLPYLLLADVQNTVLSALLTFSDRVLYPHYSEVPRIGGISALDDQAAAGVLMWVPGSIAFLGPLCWIGLRLLYGSTERKQFDRRKLPLVTPSPRPLAGATNPDSRLVSPAVSWTTGIFDRLVRWRPARRIAQTLMALLGALVIFDGLAGPQVSPLNLAGVLPWIHWRGVLVFGLLVAGNVFCFACPFTLPRAIARRWLPQKRAWPARLKSKWLAVGLMILFLWSYEAFSLWDSPWLTAWIAVGYFVAALVVDGFFRGGTFCKFVCPIGQFNFVQSLVSPFAVGVRDLEVCARCTTHECLRGSETSPGCEMQLFQPQKQGNLDCTFCFDCVHSCPHQNVGVLATLPIVDLWNDRPRSSVGRWSQRTDLAALVLVLAFGAFANAAGMVGPVVERLDGWSRGLGLGSPLLLISLYYAVAIVVLPFLTVAAAASWNRLGGIAEPIRPLATRFAFTFVPLGFAMWLAHYSFHFLTSCETLIPVTQRFVRDLGWDGLGAPIMSRACCRPVTDGLVQFELLSLGVGLLASMLAAWKIAGSLTTLRYGTLRIALPWLGLLLMLYALGVWIVFQPMQMRGALPGGG